MMSGNIIIGFHSEFPAKQKQREETIVDSVDPGGKFWYAVKCKPRQEHIVLTNLDRACMPTFFPRIRDSRSIRKKVISGLWPLFRAIDVRSEYRIVKYARGVHGIVSFGMSPAVVDEELVWAIQERLTGEAVSLGNPFRTGLVVKIQSGPLHVWKRYLKDASHLAKGRLSCYGRFPFALS